MVEPSTTTSRRTWRIGELAALAGVTVRTLHYYEQLGLIAPIEREDGAHRLYDAAAVEQLYRVKALRNCGLSLREIQSMPQDGDELASLLREHLARVSLEVTQLTQLRDKLRQLVGPGAAVAPEALLATLESMALLEQHTHQRTAAHEPDAGANTAAWNALRDELRACLSAGVDPDHDVVRPLARQANALISAFAGGNAAVHRALSQVRRTNPPQDFAGWDPPLFQYLECALAALPEEDSRG